MRRAFLQSGGTALGAVGVPIRRALSNVVVEAGVSIGANVVAMSGADRLDELEEMFRKANGAKYFQAPNIDFWNGLFTMNPLRRLYKKYSLGEGLKRPVFVGMVDAATREYKTVQLNGLSIEDVRDAVIGSSTQPLIHERTKFQGRYVLDGGIAHVMPLLPKWWEYDEIHAVFCSPVGNARKPHGVPQKDVAQATEQGGVALEMMLDRIVWSDFQRLKEYAEKVKVVVYAPKSWEQVGKSFDASPETMAKRLDIVGPWMLKNPIFDNR